jgi:hypothetical protein
MSDARFRDEIIKYLLGDDWQVINPINREQVNVEALISIIEDYKPKK